MPTGDVRRRCWSTVVLLVLFGTAAFAHVSPVVVLRRQADIIRELLPGATRFQATDVRPDGAQLAAIRQQAHYSLKVKSIRFFEGLGPDGRALGSVVFSQVDTQHGPIEVGVGIGPDGTVTGVRVSRTTAEMKPWVLDVERARVLERLTGAADTSGPVRLSGAAMKGMGGYAAEAIATATYRAIVMWQVLRK